jgi:hypothetical protein
VRVAFRLNLPFCNTSENNQYTTHKHTHANTLPTLTFTTTTINNLATHRSAVRILPPELQSEKRFTSKPAVAAPVAHADAKCGIGLVALLPPKQQQQQQQQQQQWRHADSGKYDACSMSSFYAVGREWLMQWRGYHKVQTAVRTFV